MPELHPILIGKNVSTSCRLHDTSLLSDDVENIITISYCPNGQCTNVPPADCHLENSVQMNFELLVSRPNNTLTKNTEANIYIFNVRENTNLEVFCTPRRIDRFKMTNVSTNTLMIEFVLSSKLAYI